MGGTLASSRAGKTNFHVQARRGTKLVTPGGVIRKLRLEIFWGVFAVDQCVTMVKNRDKVVSAADHHAQKR